MTFTVRRRQILLTTVKMMTLTKLFQLMFLEIFLFLEEMQTIHMFKNLRTRTIRNR
jgi:hypothetical protein